MNSAWPDKNQFGGIAVDFADVYRTLSEIHRLAHAIMVGNNAWSAYFTIYLWFLHGLPNNCAAFLRQTSHMLYIA